METDQVSNKLALSQFESKLYIDGFVKSGQNVGLYKPIGLLLMPIMKKMQEKYFR